MKKFAGNPAPLPLHPPKMSYEVAHPRLNPRFNRKNSASNCLNYLHTGPLIIDVKLKGNENFHMDVIWFCMQQKAAVTKRAYFSKIYILPHIISGFDVMWLLHLTSFCIHHTVVTDCRKNQELRVASYGITLLPNFVKINQLVQKIERVLSDAYSFSLTKKNVLNLHIHPIYTEKKDKMHQ
jgi:hypothetical protein